jgi:hypothetical protein
VYVVSDPEYTVGPELFTYHILLLIVGATQPEGVIHFCTLNGSPLVPIKLSSIPSTHPELVLEDEIELLFDDDEFELLDE